MAGGTTSGGKLRRARRLGCTSLVCATLACGSGARAETLWQALASAYGSNPSLAAERARQRSDDENIPRALSGYRPSASVDLGFGPTFQRDEQGRLSRAASGTFVLNLSQPIYDGGRTAASVRSAESGVFAGRETLRSVEQAVLLSAVTAFMNVVRDRAVVELQRANVGFLQEALRIARKRYETGDASRTDPAQAEARLGRGNADLALAEAALVASRAEYRAAIGHEAGHLIEPDPERYVEPGGGFELRGSLDGHPDVRAAMHAADAAANDVAIAASALLPTISAGGSATGVAGRTADDAPSGLSASLQLNFPIYDGGAAAAQVRQSKELVGQRRLEIEAARDQVRAAIRTNWGLLRAARLSSKAARVAVAANELALAGVRLEAERGRRTTLDVLNAQQELVNARTTLVAAQRDRVVAYHAVLASVGSLSHDGLGLSGPRYPPELHLRQVRDLPFGLRIPSGQ